MGKKICVRWAEANCFRVGNLEAKKQKKHIQWARWVALAGQKFTNKTP
jgi:hypothetical protein